MNPIDIVLTLCLMSDPSNCFQHRLQYESYEPLKQCVFDAQFYIAQYMGAHPELKLKDWGCAIPRAMRPRRRSSPDADTVDAAARQRGADMTGAASPGAVALAVRASAIPTAAGARLTTSPSRSSRDALPRCWVRTGPASRPCSR
ncbi:hypothetical protein [Methylobrevis pamukkalensis]|uniref:Uncharacterized protein n=1 Tax=Methylobrevis pamukkalensis TaxID=1439726 RepID=A0A1E3GYL1_9HYPH|nr:hypothetical protein [Methylobrevis pamukkalensis]ODN68421.1 hypothetical protein A6302_04286 [Methylobrevis pamukkalensis]